MFTSFKGVCTNLILQNIKCNYIEIALSNGAKSPKKIIIMNFVYFSEYIFFNNLGRKNLAPNLIKFRI